MKSIVLFSFILLSVLYFNSCEYNPVEPYDSTPKVSIVSPVNNSAVSDSVTIKILVNNIDVKRVELFIDHYLVSDGVFQKPPYEYYWDCRWFQEGSQHILQAKAYNKSGKVIESDYTIINIYRFMPNGLSAQILSDSITFIRWYDNCKFETGFELEQAIDDSNFIKIADLDSNTTSYSLKGQYEPEKKYYYRVRARAKDLYSGYSDVAIAEIKLTGPINLGTSLSADTAITLYWKDNNSFEKGYVISKDFGSGYFVPIKTLPANSTTTIIQDVFLANQQYRYSIHAIRDYFESPKALFPFVPLQLNIPTELKLTNQTLNSVTLRWQDNSTFETGFKVYRRDSNDNTIEVGHVNSNITSFVDNGLDTSEAYDYYVRAVSTYNISDFSNQIKVFYSPYISLNKIVQVPNGISESVVSDDFSLVAIGGYQTNNRCVRLYDLSSGTLLKTFLGRPSVDQEFVKIAISPDNKYVAAIGDYYTITIWEISSSQVYKQLVVGGTQPNFIKFTRDGNSLLVERDRTLRKYNLSDFSYTNLISFPYEPYEMVIDNSEKYFTFANYSANITVYDYQTGVLKFEIPNSSLSGQLSFEPSGKRLSFYANNKFITWDVESNTLFKSISNFGYPIYMSVSQDEKLSLFTGQNYDALTLWNISEEKRIGRFYETSNFAQIKFSPDNQRVFTREFFHSYYLWNIVHLWVQDIN